MKTVDQPIVSALIISRDGKVLMGQKPPHKAAVYPDCWHIPGGGVDEGESFENALSREILEETGIDTAAYNVTLVDNLGRGEAIRTLENDEQVLAKMQFNVFEVRIDDKDAKEIATTEEDDLENLTWFSFEELNSIKLTPPSITLLQRLGYIA
jgi:8-oxo-dGTP pyrophosphatase MutT (NUDIX family)